MGFSGFGHAFPMANDEPRAVDEGFVIVGPVEVKTKAQASSSRKEGWSHTAEGPWLQVSALLLLLELGVVRRRSLFWVKVTAGFTELGMSSKGLPI